MNKTDIPVILFAYNRAKQLKGTLAQLKKNKIPILYIFIDGPRNEQDASKVNDVIKLARSISWTKTKVIRRKSNLGLSASIQKGLDAVFFEHESAIIIEDDIIVADGFYDFMCRALKAYEDKRDIAGVTGLRYPFKCRALRKGEADVFLAPRFSSWGWGTWRRVWREVDFHQGSLVDKVYRHSPDLSRGGKDAEYAYHEYAAGRLQGCWDVVFYVNMILKGQSFVWPKKNLIQNNGLDSGEHASGSKAWTLQWEGSGNDLVNIPEDITVHEDIVNSFRKYFNSIKTPVLPRLKRQLKNRAKSLVKKSDSITKPNPKEYTTTIGPQEVLSQKECYYFALNNYVKDGDRVLDVGMGIGYGMGVLSIKAAEVFSVDVDKKAVEYNKSRLIGKNPRVKDLILYNGKKLPFKDNFFDVVTCIDVIEHVEDYEGFLLELIRVSKRAVIVATPNRRPEYTEPDGSPKNYWHLREWSYEEFDEIAQGQIVAKVHWNFVDGPWDGPHSVTQKISPDTLVLLPVFIKGKK